MHFPREFLLRNSVDRLKDSFDSKELNVIKWIDAHSYFADVLTKWNPEVFKTLREMMSSGLLRDGSSEEWRI